MANASSIVSTAEKYVGKVAYVWGGTSLTNGVDCSGFVLAILELLGYTGVPRTSESQYEWATPVSTPSPGDLVFAQFPTDTTPSPGHVGIYVGDGMVVSAQDPALGVGGVASGAAAVRLYTSPSVSQEKSAAFPAAILFTGVSLLCLYMTLRSWPVDANGSAIRPAAYAVEILQGKNPEAGPSPTDNTSAIQAGLEAIASIWVVSKVASAIGGEAGAAGLFGSIWNGIKNVFGSGEDAAGDAIEDTAFTIPQAPGLGNTGSGTQLV